MLCLMCSLMAASTICGCDRAIFAVPVTVNVCPLGDPCRIQLTQSYPSVLPSANSTVHFVPFHHRPTKPLRRRTTAPHDSCYISPMAASSFSSDAFLAAFMCLVLSWPSRKPTTTLNIFQSSFSFMQPYFFSASSNVICAAESISLVNIAEPRYRFCSLKYPALVL